MAKVAIYCRLSEEDRNKINSLADSESIQNQKTLLTNYAIDNGWNIFKIYSDDDYSGLDKDRPEWNQMLQDAEAKKFDIVLCKNQSRFTRDMELVEKYLHYKFIEWGIRFVGFSDNSDTQNKGNKKQRQINGLVNEWYCEDVSESVRAIFDMKRMEGKFIGSFATYGYQKDPKNKSKLIIDEEAAQVVRMIYRLYLEGYGTQHISYILNEKGISNPTKYKKTAGLNYINSSMNNDFGLWNKTTVKRILKNQMYIGNMVQGVRKKVSYKSKKIVATSKDSWIIAESTHAPIVEKRVFEEVQRRIGSRQRSTGEGQAHIFATKVRCADCGSTMNKSTTFRGSKRGYSYLRCKIYAIAANKSICTSHNIRLDILQSIVTQKLKDHIHHWLSDSNIACRLQSENDMNLRIGKFRNELINIDKQLQQSSLVLRNLYLDKVNGTITNVQFLELNKSFSEDKENQFRRKEDIEKTIKELNEKANNIDQWLEVVKKYKDFTELTHAMVNEFIDYIEIGEKDKGTGEQKVAIHWMF